MYSGYGFDKIGWIFLMENVNQGKITGLCGCHALSYDHIEKD
jgi:hypothetical protein